MKSNQTKTSLFFSLAALASFLPSANAAADSAATAGNFVGKPKPVIVLVHGAFADGSAWSKVIPLLEHDGYTVTAVQNAMGSLADDIATTKRVIDAQKAPVVLVGHSYGGAVITGASSESPGVKALVYIAAFAPDAGESIGPLQAKFAPSALGPALVPDAAGFLFIDRAKFHEVFAQDLPASEARTLAATQRPIFGGDFEQPVIHAGWKTLPTWYLVATDDQTINPALERFMAQRIGATISEVHSSHVPFLSHPKEVVRVIEQAARSLEK